MWHSTYTIVILIFLWLILSCFFPLSSLIDFFSLLSLISWNFIFAPSFSLLLVCPVFPLFPLSLSHVKWLFPYCICALPQINTLSRLCKEKERELSGRPSCPLFGVARYALHAQLGSGAIEAVTRNRTSGVYARALYFGSICKSFVLREYMRGHCTSGVYARA